MDCSETKLSLKKDYLEKVFKMFPNLVFLDNKDKNGQECLDDDFEDDYEEEEYTEEEDDEEEDED